MRPHLGKWIGAVAMNEDWLVMLSYFAIFKFTSTAILNFAQVCGGGPHLALYHLRSLTMSKVLLDDDSHPINCVMLNEDSIIVGVDGSIGTHFSFTVLIIN